ncbi:hypothetical protein GCM10023100_29000 [Actinocorallia cavernae]|uniref:Major facilitator superfamily (MFS) profile domain-containing protein n=2 Tax=Actinomycetes TaxID=1760 RepID=A0ABP8SKQ7_9ACTN
MVPSTPHPRRWWALGALVASMLVLAFDSTILNVALPTMAVQLGATTGQQQWVADAYVVVFAALMLPAGLLGDRFGRRRMLIAGLGVFLAGSVLGALAGDVNAVIAARAVMGVGAALIMPLSPAVLPALFGPDERGKAVGMTPPPRSASASASCCSRRPGTLRDPRSTCSPPRSPRPASAS